MALKISNPPPTQTALPTFFSFSTNSTNTTNGDSTISTIPSGATPSSSIPLASFAPSFASHKPTKHRNHKATLFTNTRKENTKLLQHNSRQDLLIRRRLTPKKELVTAVDTKNQDQTKSIQLHEQAKQTQQEQEQFQKRIGQQIQKLLISHYLATQSTESKPEHRNANLELCELIIDLSDANFASMMQFLHQGRMLIRISQCLMNSYNLGEKGSLLLTSYFELLSTILLDFRCPHQYLIETFKSNEFQSSIALGWMHPFLFGKLPLCLKPECCLNLKKQGVHNTLLIDQEIFQSCFFRLATRLVVFAPNWKSTLFLKFNSVQSIDRFKHFLLLLQPQGDSQINRSAIKFIKALLWSPNDDKNLMSPLFSSTINETMLFSIIQSISNLLVKGVESVLSQAKHQNDVDDTKISLRTLDTFHTKCEHYSDQLCDDFENMVVDALDFLTFLLTHFPNKEIIAKNFRMALIPIRAVYLVNYLSLSVSEGAINLLLTLSHYDLYALVELLNVDQNPLAHNLLNLSNSSQNQSNILLEMKGCDGREVKLHPNATNAVSKMAEMKTKATTVNLNSVATTNINTIPLFSKPKQSYFLRHLICVFQSMAEELMRSINSKKSSTIQNIQNTQNTNDQKNINDKNETTDDQKWDNKLWNEINANHMIILFNLMDDNMPIATMFYHCGFVSNLTEIVIVSKNDMLVEIGLNCLQSFLQWLPQTYSYFASDAKGAQITSRGLGRNRNASTYVAAMEFVSTLIYQASMQKDLKVPLLESLELALVLERLEVLQEHENSEVSSAAERLVSEFEDEDDIF